MSFHFLHINSFVWKPENLHCTSLPTLHLKSYSVPSTSDFSVDCFRFFPCIFCARRELNSGIYKTTSDRYTADTLDYKIDNKVYIQTIVALVLWDVSIFTDLHPFLPNANSFVHSEDVWLLLFLTFDRKVLIIRFSSAGV